MTSNHTFYKKTHSMHSINNRISIATSPATIQYSYQTSAAQSAHESDTSVVRPISETKGSSTLVNISSAAREKLAEDQSTIGKNIASQMQSQKTEQTEETNVSDSERLDEIIKDTQEQIKEVQQEIRALNNENSENAEAQRKALDAQLVSLNATLIGLMGKKLDMAE